MRQLPRGARRLPTLWALAMLAACSGGGTSPPATKVQSFSSGQPTRSQAATFAYGAGLLAGSTAHGPVAVGSLKVDVAVRLRNGPGLVAYAKAASTRGSGLYRHFLTPRQIADQYGATAADYRTTAAYFRRFGLQVGGWTQRLSLAVAGPQAKMEAAFHTHFVSYTTPLGTVYGPKETPALDSSLPVTAVANLIGGPRLRHRAFVHVAAPAGAGQNIAAGYVPQQLAAAFDFNGAYNAGFRGDGITIGIAGTGPIDPNDLATFKQLFNVPGAATVTQAPVSSAAAAVDGGGPGEGSPTATPPPVTAPCSGSLPACNPEDGEAQIDTEQTAALGYNANVLFYLAYVPAECQSPNSPGSAGPCDATNPAYLGPQIGLPEADDEIQQAIMDNTADILSLSFGAAELGAESYFVDPATDAYTSAGFGPSEFAALAAEGIATFVSSGDAGAQACAASGIAASLGANCVNYPASDDNVTAVGGVTTPLDNAGRFVGPITAWGQQTQAGAAGSGGGISSFVPIPSWQTGPGIASSFRNVPDVALEADSVTGVATIVNASFGFVNSGAYGGTSVAAPETAAMWALVLSACKQTPSCVAAGSGPHPYRFGNAAPRFYGIYTDATQYPATFYDVVFGNNGVTPCEQIAAGCGGASATPEPGFNAGVGYDRTTGIGVPFARHLISAVVGV